MSPWLRRLGDHSLRCRPKIKLLLSLITITNTITITITIAIDIQHAIVDLSLI